MCWTRDDAAGGMALAQGVAARRLRQPGRNRAPAEEKEVARDRLPNEDEEAAEGTRMTMQGGGEGGDGF